MNTCKHRKTTVTYPGRTCPLCRCKAVSQERFDESLSFVSKMALIKRRLENPDVPAAVREDVARLMPFGNEETTGA